MPVSSGKSADVRVNVRRGECVEILEQARELLYIGRRGMYLGAEGFDETGKYTVSSAYQEARPRRVAARTYLSAL